MTHWFVVVGGYVLGSVLAGDIVVSRAAGRAPEEMGENPGIAGTFRIAGLRGGTIAMILDLCKGALPVAVAIHLGFGTRWLMAAAAAPVIGHNWSLFKGLDGGLGLGPATGVVMWLAWPQMLPAYLAGAIAWYFTRWVPVIAIVSLPLGLLLLWLTGAPASRLGIVGAIMVVEALRGAQAELGRARSSGRGTVG
jgi:glycerol-3-phosphate acyltransferase PlsY